MLYYNTVGATYRKTRINSVAAVGRKLHESVKREGWGGGAVDLKLGVRLRVDSCWHCLGFRVH